MVAHTGPVENIYVEFNFPEAGEDIFVDEALVGDHIDRSAVAQVTRSRKCGARVIDSIENTGLIRQAHTKENYELVLSVENRNSFIVHL